MKAPHIRAELQVRGWRSRRLAAELGVTDSAVYRVIHGKATSRRIANEIARITSIPVARLWPGRYDGQPRKAA
ncbi:MAG: helix-turn-helix domain-containing protein [Panacagrimonas sp.]